MNQRVNHMLDVSKVNEVPGDTQMERILSRVFDRVEVSNGSDEHDANSDSLGSGTNAPTRLRVDLDSMNATYATRFVQ